MTKISQKTAYSSSVLYAIFALLICCCGCRDKSDGKTIVCIGDSLTVCGGLGGRYSDWLAAWLPNENIINMGINGDTLDKGRLRFQQDVLELNPDIVIIELGANDFWRMSRDISELKADLEDMVKRAKQLNIEVVIASCFGGRDYSTEGKVEFGPERYGYASAIAATEEEICGKYNCFYVPNMQVDIKNDHPRYWADKNHPNKDGNKYVAKRILTELKKAINSAKRK